MGKGGEERTLIGEGEHEMEMEMEMDFVGPISSPLLKVRCVEGVEHAHISVSVAS